MHLDLNIGPLGRGADLPRLQETGGDKSCGGDLQIGMARDDGGIIASRLDYGGFHFGSGGLRARL